MTINHHRPLVASVMALALAVTQAKAQEVSATRGGEPPARLCGEIEQIVVNGTVIGRQVTENCIRPREEEAREGSGSNALGIVAGALAIGGLAAGLAGGGGGSSNETPPNPEPAPQPTPGPSKPPNLAPPANTSNPTSWRGTEFNRQYGLGLIGAEYRYAAGATGQGTLGAIFDNGIDLNHDDVGGIRLDLSHSYEGSSTDLRDTDGHGTFVYGIAGARRNGIGIHGVAPDTDFMILRWGNNSDIDPQFANALQRAMNARADAMNNSWVIVNPSTDQTHLISSFDTREDLNPVLSSALIERIEATASAGLSVIFSTGNDGASEPALLAGLPHVLSGIRDNWIAVTALDVTNDIQTARIWGRANRCGVAMHWCLAAPGTRITSLDAGGTLTTADGTSNAAPHVTGAVLVLKSQFPEMTTPEVHRILFDTAVDLGDPGVDPVYGQGALNLNEAMRPQGALMVELGAQVDQNAIPLGESFMVESSVTGGALTAALQGQGMLVTDRYDRGYVALMHNRVAPNPSRISPDAQAGLKAAFSQARTHTVDKTPDGGFDLRFNAFGPDHDVTRIAHVDPVMALASRSGGPAFSMSTPMGDMALSLASSTGDGIALSLGLARAFEDGHRISMTLGQYDEERGFLGATGFGAFGAMQAQTLYGRVQADIRLRERMMLNASATAGQTRFRSDGILKQGRADTLAMALGVTLTDAFATGDSLSFALARPFAVQSGTMTLQAGAGISAAANGRRTNAVRLAETQVPLGRADRAPELHLGYLHAFEAARNQVTLGVGAVARLDGGPQMDAAQVALTVRF